MNPSCGEAIDDLRDRAARPGLGPIPWPAITQRLAALKSRVGQDLTTLALAADGLQAAAEDEWPAEVTSALQRLGWPDHWDPRSLGQLWHPVDPGEARGFVSGVKGTVFEEEVAQRVESGELSLPDGGDRLRLAEDVQQPGWDAEVLDGEEVIGVVQMKATDSVGYLQEHLERYPGIDGVITTSEVAQTAAERGVDVVDSGIANDDLEEAVQGAVDSLDAASLAHEYLPVYGLGSVAVRAVVAARRGASRDEVSALLKEEGISLLAVNAAGLLVETATGTVFLRPVTTTAIRLGTHRARVARRSAEDLAEQQAALAGLTTRARQLVTAAGKG
ncbi:hypothetical protein [Geodermatophilus sp. SYSU D01105]